MKQTNIIQFLNTYKIKMPAIQREYAQGRKGKYAEMVRKLFIEAIFADSSNSKGINMDFIYGKADEGYFTPLDGQQRITTLYLVYLYLLAQTDATSTESISLEYEERHFANEFCKTLQQNLAVLKFDGGAISEKIFNKKWFVSEWVHSPTVAGMMTMFDAINEKYMQKTICLETLENITFFIFPMDDFNLTDSLYIKMNARGKPLTDFEVFKSELVGWMGKKTKEYEEYEHLLNGKWLDHFWEIGRDNMDDYYLRFIVTLFSCYFYAVEKNADNADEGKLSEMSYFTDLQNADQSIFDELMLKTLETAKQVIGENEKIIYYPYGNKKDDEQLYFKILQAKSTYTDRALFFYHCLTINNQTEDEDKWRFASNILTNTDIDKKNYARILAFTKQLAEDPSWNLSNIPPYKSGLGVNEEQYEEELEKAARMCQNPDWKEAIIRAENHLYFRGKINFLLEWADITELDKFNDYAIKIRELFADDSSTGLKEDYKKTLRQALLCMNKEYFATAGHYRYLVENHWQTWRMYLTQQEYSRDKEIKSKRLALKELFDEIGAISLENLNSFINKHKGFVKGWKRILIEYPVALKRARDSCFYGSSYDPSTDEYLLILNSSQVKGKCFDLLFYVMHKLLFDNKDPDIYGGGGTITGTMKLDGDRGYYRWNTKVQPHSYGWTMDDKDYENDISFDDLLELLVKKYQDHSGFAEFVQIYKEAYSK